MKLRICAVIAISTFFVATLAAQDASRASSENPSSTYTFSDYLDRVARFNLDLAAARFDIAVADAQIAVARVFPDPVLTGGVASIDVSRQGSPTVATVGLSIPIEFPTKRGARIGAARAAATGTRADVEEFFRSLRAEAANAYIDALDARLVLERKQRTLASFERLVQVNETRFRAGDVGEIAVVQSRVEAEQFRGEVLLAASDVRAADLQLLLRVGGAPEGAAAALSVRGDLSIPPREFDVEQLIAHARVERPDVASRRAAQHTAEERIDLAYANRWVDVSVNVGWQHSFASGTTFGPTPPYDALGATLSIPIPLSNIYRGELDASLALREQADQSARALELRVEVEVRSAVARYQAAVSRMRLYTAGLLADADRVFETTLYNYQHGGATLLEVLNAQRTVNDVYLAYYQAIADHARELVAVEQAAGIWDIRIE